ncbi:Oidioi.mRNA.OKI2018_I69.chr1.g3328.t1.cds [Oikopleura dioica]|uniref:Oidioi.mRNA.OKI2018_I69.chr1.g3328.t1.cds n=1 Tax=Oikopleura dioica TaxID=34765 RepID=A0ABN7STT5_OIKDI|nr:Oidioi.mRNA.OKI2018_I69.chr1.g3328.t1.cds [Oikopleura dioica]
MRLKRVFATFATFSAAEARGCRILDNCAATEVCIWTQANPAGACLPLSNRKRDQELYQPGYPNIHDAESEYQRQLERRRKELLKKQLEKRELARLVQEYRRSPPDYEDQSTSNGGGLFWDSSEPKSDFKSFQSESYQVNGGPEHIKVSTDDNGKINNYETNINPDGTVERVTEPEEVLEPMPMPAKRVADPELQKDIDRLDLFAIKEEKRAMILTFGAGGLLCAVLVISGLTLFATRRKKQPPMDFPAGDYEQLCRQHFAAKESQEISPSDWSDSKDGFLPNDELTVEQARSLLAASTDDNAIRSAWRDANSSPSDESTNGGGEHPGKDRDPGYLPYESNRFKFKQSDLYYNASNVKLADDSWLLSQSPLPGQLSEFWTMIWESERTALILLSPLQEDGMPQSARFWPNEGAELHGGIEVNLVTEHVWCREFLVRSLYLRQIETGETRTVTLLHYLGWPLNSTPPSAKRLLEFRRKARRAGSPVVICPDGASRSGAYCLIDSIISAYSKGKEPKPAELLSALRDQRMKSIRTESQLNFVIEAMGEAAESALQN